MRSLLWLYPLLYSIYSGASKQSDVASVLNVPSNTVKTMVYHARKFGLVKKEGNELKLTEEGIRMLKSYEVLDDSNLKRLLLKGEDGCFLIVVRRKRGVKTLRVPCPKPSASSPGSPPPEEPQNSQA